MMVKIEIQKIRVILFAVLLGTGFIGGQAWGSKENDLESPEFKEWVEQSQEDAVKNYRDTRPKLERQIKNLQNDLQTTQKQIVDTKELTKLEKLQKKFKEIDDSANLQFNINREINSYKNAVSVEERNYLEKKRREAKDEKNKLENLKEQTPQYEEYQNLLVEQKKNQPLIESSEKLKKTLSEKQNGLNKLKADMLKIIENKQAINKNITASLLTSIRNTILYSCMGGLLSGVRIGVDYFAGKHSCFDTIRYNLKPLGIGAAISCLTIGYNYKKLANLAEDNKDFEYRDTGSKTVKKLSKSFAWNLTATCGLIGHGLGMVTGAILGSGILDKKLGLL